MTKQSRAVQGEGDPVFDSPPPLRTAANIHPGLLAPEVVLLSTLSLDIANARKHPDRNLDAIKSSLVTFGQRKPIVVRRSSREVIAGNGTLAAARSLAWDSLAVVWVDDDTTLATAFGIADNKTAELAEWDENILGTLLAGLSDTPIDMTTLGFSDAEISELIAKLDPPMLKPASEEFGDRHPVSFVTTGEQADVIKNALDLVRRNNEGKSMDDGRCLLLLSLHYLDTQG